MSIFNFFQGNNLFIVFFGFFLALFSWNIFLQIQLRKIKKNQKVLFSGKTGVDLEEIILKQTKSLQLLDKDIQELYSISNRINSLSFRGLHKLGLVRFNPFKDIGGDQSFSIAFLDGKNSGIVLSSLFTREGSKVYSKSIVGGVSEKHPLTEEEKEAIKKAINGNLKKAIKE